MSTLTTKSGAPLPDLGPLPKKARRGTSNGNVNGNSEDRRRRKLWLLETYPADCAIAVPQRFQVELIIPVSKVDQYRADGDTVHLCCRCYRCGKLVTFETMSVDRRVPGCKGGTYKRENIRPACADCNSLTGGKLAISTKHKCRVCAKEDPHDKRRPRPLVQSKCATHSRG